MSVSKTLKLMLLGAPGAGKGTYASRLAPKMNIPTISTGDLVREQIKQQSEIGKEIENYSKLGMLVPDEIILDMVKERLLEKDCEFGYILDGFPRTVPQAMEFDNSVDKLDLVVDVMLKEEYLMEKLLGRRGCGDCGKNWNIAYIKNESEGVDMPPLLPKSKSETHCDCGGELQTRSDDNEKVIKKRLEIYHKETEPLIDYYKQQNKLFEFEVKKGLDDLPKLEKKINKHFDL